MAKPTLKDMEKDLKAIEKAFGELSNKQILIDVDSDSQNKIQWLIDGQRDFFKIIDQSAFDKEIESLLEQSIIGILQGKTFNKTKFFEECAEAYRKVIIKNMEDQLGSPASLKDSTIKSKNKRGLDSRIGIATKELLNDIKNAKITIK